MENPRKNLPFYAKSRVTYNLRSRKNYSKFITNYIRRIERTQHVSDDDGVLPDEALVNVDLKLNGSRVRFKLVTSSFHIAGFEIGYHSDRLWEMRVEGDTVLLRGSHAIGFRRVSYPPQRQCNRDISFVSLTSAVSRLIGSRDPDQNPDLRNDVLLIGILIVEAARCQWIFETCNKYVQKHMCLPVDQWVGNIAILSPTTNRCSQNVVILSEDEQQMVQKREGLSLFEEEDETAERVAKDVVRALHLA